MPTKGYDTYSFSDQLPVRAVVTHVARTKEAINPISGAPARDPAYQNSLRRGKLVEEVFGMKTVALTTSS